MDGAVAVAAAKGAEAAILLVTARTLFRYIFHYCCRSWVESLKGIRRTLM